MSIQPNDTHTSDAVQHATPQQSNQFYSADGSLVNRKGILAPHTARIPCDHCGDYHGGESFLSFADAYAKARGALGSCRELSVANERYQANSLRNTL